MKKQFILNNIKTIIKDRETEYRLKNYAVMHAFGHGIGINIHERPILRSSIDCILKEDSVIAVEPGVYIPGKFGIRIEDTVIVGKSTGVSLTKSSKEIIASLSVTEATIFSQPIVILFKAACNTPEKLILFFSASFFIKKALPLWDNCIFTRL